eukprot:scaffold1221_cov107-Isochrysis_galbana.AAC.9
MFEVRGLSAFGGRCRCRAAAHLLTQIKRRWQLAAARSHDWRGTYAPVPARAHSPPPPTAEPARADIARARRGAAGH